MPATETATFGGGCFWCTEAVFQRLKGVVSVTPGYSGGDTPNPTYDQVVSGLSGHAESIQIVFDPSVLSYPKLLEVFFKTHDPTTKNQQGADIGSQYRSTILYHNEKQKETAEKYKELLGKSGVFKDPIVTDVVAYKNFYAAEDYHKNFYDRNRMSPYCMFVVDPKLEKLREEFPSYIKE